MTIKVYPASKLHHVELWHKWREEWTKDDIIIVARWPFSHVGTVPDRSHFAKVFWQHDLEDVIKADVVLVYAVDGEHLKGALVEAGMAIALGKHVIVVGIHPDYSTWQYHPLVHRVPDLEDATTLMKCLNM